MSKRDVTLVNIVKEIREGFTQQQYEGPKQVWRALSMVGYLYNKYFKNMVRSGMIPNWPITLEDINNANTIFGSDVP